MNKKNMKTSTKNEVVDKTEKEMGYKDVFTQKEYLKLVLANVINRFGDSIDSIVFPYISKKFAARFTLAIGGMTIGVAYLVMIITSVVTKNTFFIYIIVSILMFSMGAGLAIASTVINIQFMKMIDKEYLARAGSILSAGGTLSIPIVAGFCSIIANKIPISNIFIALGILCIILYLYILFSKIQFEQEEQD